MSSVSRETSSPVKERGADSGRVTERLVVDLLIALDTLQRPVII
jgi:hypothetical protein